MGLLFLEPARLRFGRLALLEGSPLAVEEWKARHGTYLWRAAKSTMWIFAALACSYVAEFALLWFTRSPGLMVVGTYIPAWLDDPMERRLWVS